MKYIVILDKICFELVKDMNEYINTLYINVHECYNLSELCKI